MMSSKSRISANPSIVGIAIALNVLGLATGVATWAAHPFPYGKRQPVSAGPVVPAPRNHGYRQTRWVRWNGAAVRPPYPDYPQLPVPAAGKPTPLQPETIPAPDSTDETGREGRDKPPEAIDPKVPLDDKPPTPPGDFNGELPPLPGEFAPEPAQPPAAEQPGPTDDAPKPAVEPDGTPAEQPLLPEPVPLFPNENGAGPDNLRRDGNLPPEGDQDSPAPGLFDDPDSIFDDVPTKPDQSRHGWNRNGVGKTIVFNQSGHQGRSAGRRVAVWQELTQSQVDSPAGGWTANGWRPNPLRNAQRTVADQVAPDIATDYDQRRLPQWQGVRSNPLRQ